MKSFSVPFNFEDMQCNDLESLISGLTENWQRAKDCIYSGDLSSFLRNEDSKLSEYVAYIVKNTEQYLVVDELDDKKDIGTFIAIYALGASIDKVFWRGRSYQGFSELAGNVENDKTICNLLMNSAISLSMKVTENPDKDLIRKIEDIEAFSVDYPLEGGFSFQYEFSNKQDIIVNEKHYDSFDAIIEDFDENDNNFYSFLEDVIYEPSFAARMWKDGYDDIYEKYLPDEGTKKLDRTSLELQMLEEVSVRGKRTVRNYELLKGKYSYIYWLLEHLNYYEYKGKRASNLKAKLQDINFDTGLTISAIEKKLEDLKTEYHEFIKYLIDNPYDISYSVFTKDDLEESIIPLTIDSMFVAEIGGERVSIAYIKSIVGEKKLAKYLKDLDYYERNASIKYERYESAYKEQKKKLNRIIQSGSVSKNNGLIVKVLVLIVIAIVAFKFTSINYIETKTVSITDNILNTMIENQNEKLGATLTEKIEGLVNGIGQACKKELGENIIENYSDEVLISEKTQDGSTDSFATGEDSNNKFSAPVDIGKQYIQAVKIVSFSIRAILIYAIIIGIIEAFKSNKIVGSVVEKEFKIIDEENETLNKRYSNNKDEIKNKIEQGQNVEIFLGDLTTKAEILNLIYALNEGKANVAADVNGKVKFCYYVMSLILVASFGTLFMFPLLLLTKLFIDVQLVFSVIKYTIYAFYTLFVLKYIVKKVNRYNFSDWIKEITHYIIYLAATALVLAFVIIKFS